MRQKTTFYFSEKDFLNGRFPNISVLDVRAERKKDSACATTIFTCECAHCGDTFEITRSNLAKIAKESETYAQRAKVTCETMLQKVVFCNQSAYIGKKFNHLTIKGFVDDGFVVSKSSVICECDCGSTTHTNGKPLIFRLGNVINGMTKSCGCLRSEVAKSNAPSPLKDSGIHKTKERLYGVWQSMIARCNNPNKKEYAGYGGRGITVCLAWRSDYMKFRKWALSNGYDPNAPRGVCTLDRIDNNKGYKPSNCRWVSSTVQHANKVDTLLYSYYGRTMNAHGWSKHLNIDYQDLLAMLHQGMSIGQIIKKHKLQNTDFKE